MSGRAHRAGPTASDAGMPEYALDAQLLPAVRRMYPTARCVVLHQRLAFDPVTRFQRIDSHLHAFNAAGRPLVPLRPDELPELHDALTERHAGGYVTLAVPEPESQQASAAPLPQRVA